MNKRLIAILVMLCLVSAAACQKPEQAGTGALPEEIAYAPDAPQTAEIALDAAESGEQAPGAATGAATGDATGDAEGTDAESAHFEAAAVAGIPRMLETLTAAMKMTTDENGDPYYTDGTTEVTSYVWTLDGERAWSYRFETAQYRYICQYTENGKLFSVTAVPMSDLEPGCLCSDAYLRYAELYFYGEAYFGYLYSDTEGNVVTERCFGRDNAPHHTVVLTLNVYADAEKSVLFDAAGVEVCTVNGVEDDSRTYLDGSGNQITEQQYDTLAEGVSGDWLNDYYGNVYGA